MLESFALYHLLTGSRYHPDSWCPNCSSFGLSYISDVGGFRCNNCGSYIIPPSQLSAPAVNGQSSLSLAGKIFRALLRRKAVKSSAISDDKK